MGHFFFPNCLNKSRRGFCGLNISENGHRYTDAEILLQPSDFDSLNIIHIAGTKGKGSTSAFISSILCQYAFQQSESNSSTLADVSQPRYPRKIGLFTSPHLRSVRERIQINNEPVSEQLFARYFFEVWDRLETSASKLGPPSFTIPATPPTESAPPAPPDAKPVYFRYLTLMAFHAYISEGVDTAIIECGIGGEYDSTNILVAPVVSAVTSLGIDHTAMLGNTIEDIAWHKAGVFKSAGRARTAYTVDSQPSAALKVLEQRAQDKGLELCAVPRHKDIENGDAALGLAADFQKINASLAVAVAAAHLRTLGITNGIPDAETSWRPLPAEFRKGLEDVQWGGRCEVRRQGNVIWHLDGGHTMESIKLAAEWFAGCIDAQSAKRQTRILLFNQQTRDAAALAGALHAALDDVLPRAATADAGGAGNSKAPLFDHALFSTNITFAADGSNASKPAYYKPDLVSINTSTSDVEKLTVQKGLAEKWSALDAGCNVAVMGTIEQAVGAVRGRARAEEDGELVVLVTGSLHLVGGVLEVLESR